MPLPENGDRAGALWIGISGWQYDGWRGDFYPPGLPRTKQLAYAASQFDSMELNGSFYSLQRQTSYLRWRDETPAGFLFAVKGGRFITHFKRLQDVEVALANFFASGVTLLADKLGPILWQLPERVSFDRAVVADFLQLLPTSVAAAVDLAGRNDRQLDVGVLTPSSRRIRHAIEVRHQSFRDEAYFTLLDEHGVASVVADSAGRWPMLEESTGDFDYVRLHGHSELYASRYGDRLIDEWAERCRAGADAGRDVHVYFDNDARGHAPHDALRLSRRLGLRE